MNKKIFFFALVTTLGINAFGQTKKYFEGKVEYAFSFKADRIPNAQKLLAPVIGSGSVLYFKEGNFRHEYAEGLLEFGLYNRNDNKTYSKKRNNDTIYWSDCSVPGETIQQLMYAAKSDTVLGIVCDRLTIQYKDKSEIHYYNSDYLRTNPQWFEQFKRDEENIIDRKEQSIFLKAEYIFDQFTLIETAVKVSAGPISMEKFKVPANSILALGE